MRKSTGNEVLSAFGGIFVALLLAMLATIMGGYATMFLWNGLISPTFGVMTLSLSQGIGLDLFVSFITSKSGTSEEKSVWKAFAKGASLTLLYMLLGWVVMFFI